MEADRKESLAGVLGLSRCDSCAPEFGCWDATEKCYKVPKAIKVPASRLRCDACLESTYPNWSRCQHCAHYFCDKCMNSHGCGTRFRCAEQIELEAQQPTEDGQ